MLSEWVETDSVAGHRSGDGQGRAVDVVYRHTCGQARRMVQAMEDKEHPFKDPEKAGQCRESKV